MRISLRFPLAMLLHYIHPTMPDGWLPEEPFYPIPRGSSRQAMFALAEGAGSFARKAPMAAMASNLPLTERARK